MLLVMWMSGMLLVLPGRFVIAANWLVESPELLCSL